MTQRIALVTGANQGIGLAAVEMLLEQGLTVILTARDEAKGHKAAKNLSPSANLYVHQLDVSDSYSVKRVADFVAEKFGRLDVLINNAGIHYDTWQQVLNADMDEVRQTFDTNVFGAWRMAQILAPLLRQSDSGRVVNISSGGGALRAQNGSTPAYSLSKLAMNGLTMQLSQMLATDGIAVNSVCPGWVRTQMGGMGADRSPRQGADTAVWLATQGEQFFTGKFWRDRQVIEW